MTKRRRRLLVALAVLAGLGTLALPAVHWRLYGWLRSEPFYQGRPASYYAGCIRGYYAAPAEERPLSPNGEWALMHLPPRVFDVLWNHPPPFLSVRWAAAGKDVVRHVRQSSVERDALPVLLALANDDDARVQWWAATCLANFDGEDVKPALPALMRMLDAPDPDVRYVGAWALGSVGSAARPAVPRLRQLLTDPAPIYHRRARVADAAAEALLGIDPDSAPPWVRP
jgi:hypothetical protein